MKKESVSKFIDAIEKTWELAGAKQVRAAYIRKAIMDTVSKGKFVLEDDLALEEYLAITTTVAILAHEQRKLKLCGEAYEILIFVSLKAKQTRQVTKIVELAIEMFPAEIFDGVLRGIRSYDEKFKVNDGEQVLLNALGSKQLKEVQAITKERSFIFKGLTIWKIIKELLLAAAIGSVIAYLLSLLFYTR